MHGEKKKDSKICQHSLLNRESNTREMLKNGDSFGKIVMHIKERELPARLLALSCLRKRFMQIVVEGPVVILIILMLLSK